MPTEDWGLYEQGLTTGTQVSSTYEGRHITATAAELNHGNQTVVTKGYPVIFGINAASAYGVGVAFNTEVAGTDLIAVDTEGIWNLTVLATDDAAGAGGVVRAGDPLYISTTTALISKIRNLVTQIPFGYALGGIAQDQSEVIAVKVHWDPRQPQDEYAVFAAGHAADNAMSINVTDTSALAAGNHRALHISYGNTVNMVGGIRGLGVDVVSTGDAASMNAISVYTGGLGTATIPEISGLNVYMDDIGAGASCSQKFCINLNNDNGDDATIGGFIRVYSHAANLDCVIYLGNNGGNMIDNLLYFSAGVEPYSAGTLTDSAAGDILCDSRIRILVAATPMWIPLYNTAP